MLNKDAFQKVSYGIYLVASNDGDTKNAYIANTVFQVSSNPAKFAVSCHKDNFTTGLIEKSSCFSFSILREETPLEFIQKFGYQSAHKDSNKFRSLNFKKGKTGCPIIYDNTVSWFECKVSEKIDVGTHILFIGEVVDNGMLDSSEEPMTYSYYRREHKGASPSKAPTYVDPDNEIKSAVADDPAYTQYACTICEYVYNPAKGDPINGVKAGTTFEDIPDDWVCPICGATKMVFTEI